MGKASREKAERRNAAVGAAARKAERKWLFPVVVGLVAALGIVLIVIVAGGNTRTSGDTETRSSPLAEGEQAPALSGTDLDGEEVALEAPPAKPTLVVFWAHWCPHCQRELPLIQQFSEQEGSRYDMIGVTTAIGRQPASAEYADPQAFVDTFGLTMPTIVDEDNHLAGAWGVTGFPAMYVVAPDGRITKSFSGEVPVAEVAAALQAAEAS